MRRSLLGLASFLFVLCLAIAASAATVVGAVSRIQGKSVVTSEGTTITVVVGTPVAINAVVATHAGARVEITFEDGTSLVLGEKARVTIDTFVFKPRGQGNKLKFGITGSFRFVSGKLNKMPAASASVVTPVATIGIRGTDFWGGTIDGEYGVFLASGAVSVTTSNGTSVLDRAGEGVNITLLPKLRGRPGAGGLVRGPVTIWSADKVKRANASIAFD